MADLVNDHGVRVHIRAKGDGSVEIHRSITFAEHPVQWVVRLALTFVAGAGLAALIHTLMGFMGTLGL